MRNLFDEYSALLLYFVCSMVGFDLLYKVITSGECIHDIVDFLLYGVL